MTIASRTKSPSSPANSTSCPCRRGPGTRQNPRTIADLDGSAGINAEHVSEAVNYRLLDRQFWS